MAGLLLTLNLLLLCCSAPDSVEPLEREVYLMGTSFRITLYEPDRARGIQQLERAIEIVEQTENELSTWRETSELSQLNRAELMQPYAMSSPTCDLLAKVARMVQLSEGAFDPAIGRLEEVRKAQDAQATQIQDALQNTGWRYLELDGCRAIKKRPITLDAGAFGKGEAIDRVLQLAEQNVFSPLVMNFGGQIAARGKKVEIQLADPMHRDQTTPVILAINAGSVSTSSQSVQPGHILDPRTGNPAPAFGSVTVWHQRALDADMLSTALFVMGPEVGFKWAVKNHIAACFLIAGDQVQVRLTPEFQALKTER
jgi:thiamine biosynthesis lipoprotein